MRHEWDYEWNWFWWTIGLRVTPSCPVTGEGEFLIGLGPLLLIYRWYDDAS